MTLAIGAVRPLSGEDTTRVQGRIRREPELMFDPVVKPIGCAQEVFPALADQHIPSLPLRRVPGLALEGHLDQVRMIAQYFCHHSGGNGLIEHEVILHVEDVVSLTVPYDRPASLNGSAEPALIGEYVKGRWDVADTGEVLTPDPIVVGVTFGPVANDHHFIDLGAQCLERRSDGAIEILLSTVRDHEQGDVSHGKKFIISLDTMRAIG